MTLLGRADSATKDGMTFAADLAENLAHGDAAYLGFLDFVDAHVARTDMDVPDDPAARVIASTPAAMHQPIRQLNFREQGIGAVLWATGYDLDFSWIDIPVLDEQGAPIHDKGVTQFPGLYFLGLNFLSKFSSSFLIGVAEDAERLALDITRGVNGATTTVPR